LVTNQHPNILSLFKLQEGGGGYSAVLTTGYFITGKYIF